MGKIDPLSHVMNISLALKDSEERKKLIEPVNFEGPFDRACYLLNNKGRISLLIEDKPGRGKSTFLFTILAKGPMPTYKYRKLKSDQETPECLKGDGLLIERIMNMPRKFLDTKKLNEMSRNELHELFSKEKYIIIDDIHFLDITPLGVLKEVLESNTDLNIIATMVPRTAMSEEEEVPTAPIDILEQVADRFDKRARIDPMDAQALKRILKRRLIYALGEAAEDPNVQSVIESVAYTISFFSGALGGELVVRRGILLLRDYLRGELLRDFEVIIQNILEGVNVRATMVPYTMLIKGIGDDSISFREIRMTSAGISTVDISLHEPAVIGTVNYSSKHGQVRFYARIGGKIQSRRRLQIPDIISKQVVMSPEIFIIHVETNITSSVLHPELAPPLDLVDKFNDMIRDLYYDLDEKGLKINKLTVVQTYNKLRREVRKRAEMEKYVNELKSKLGYGGYDLALNRLIIYWSLKAMAEIFPSP